MQHHSVPFVLQRESKNSSDRNANTFEHVYLFQEMRVPSARRIRECETLLKGDSASGKLSTPRSTQQSTQQSCCAMRYRALPMTGRRLLDIAAVLLADGTFAQEIGSKAGRSAEHLRYGLWLAQQQLQGSAATAFKAVHIYSNNMDPSVGAKPKDK